MCGLVAAVDLRGRPRDPVALRRAADLLSRRGPDDRGEWSDDFAAMAHRRLAILDLTPAGHQPMLSVDGRYVIVYNGEVYNFRELREQLADQNVLWRSESDTETLLAAYQAWGKQAICRLRGMFSLAIWDRHTRSLFAARDRMGVKPLYYAFEPGKIVLGSRPRALLSLGAGRDGIDDQALRCYLEGGLIPAPLSIWNGVQKLPPGHWMSFGESGLHIESYWNYRSIRPEKAWENRPEEDLLDELEGLIADSVRVRMISDVPLGALLSGGVDSGLVTAMLAKYATGKIATFTIGFDDPAFDESDGAKKVAAHLGVDHHLERLNVDDLLGLLPMFREEFDEPFFDNSAFPVMAVSRLARRTVTVALSGDGGDELFGGYHYYPLAKALAWAYSAPSAIRAAGASALSLVPGHKPRLLAGALRQGDVPRAFAFARGIGKDFQSVISDDVLRRTTSIADYYANLASSELLGLDAVDVASRLDMAFTLPDLYLQKVDLGSMAFSLECREPMLDQFLIEWAMRLPSSWKVRGVGTKYLLKRLAYRYLPQHILDRPKRGFGVPMARWLRGPLSEWATQLINDDRVFEVVPLRRDVVRSLLREHLSGARDVSPLLWAILVLLDFVERDRVSRWQ